MSEGETDGAAAAAAAEPADADELVGEAEAAALLGVTPRALEGLRRKGAIDAVSERSGWRRTWRYRHSSIDAYLRAERERKEEAPAKTHSEMFAELVNAFPFPREEERDEPAPADASPLVRLANALLANAIDFGASHLYIEPRHQRHGVGVRLRIDGIVREVMPLPPHIYTPVLNRFKVMADLPAEASAPQTGTIPIKHNGLGYRLRVDTVPTRYGESIAIAIQEETRSVGLNRLGMEPGTQDAYEEILARPSGLTLLAGAAGQGTTTTLYNSLHKINSVASRIVVLTATGDPAISGTTQVPPADADRGQTEADRVRGALAQRPDVLVFSEIRDAETMRFALDAAEDGIRVLGAMRAPYGAVSAIERMTDWGVAPARLARLLNGVLAQRLVRTLCLDCRTSYQASDAEVFGNVSQVARLFLEPDRTEGNVLYLAGGCETCGGTGYRGRSGVFEMLTVGSSVRAFLGGSRREADSLGEAAERDGMLPREVNATRKLLRGVTSRDELHRAGLR